jgi:hypothetical protein
VHTGTQTSANGWLVCLTSRPGAQLRLLGVSSAGLIAYVEDSDDNALAEAIFGLYKAEVFRRKGPWRNLEDVEFPTLEWVDWFNHRRLFGLIGNIPPAEFEALYDRTQAEPARAAGLT